MDKYKGVLNGRYAGFWEEPALLLSLSFSEVKRKYADFPICLMDYYEKNIREKSIEIRFDEKELTVTCTFNTKEICDRIYLFPDKNEFAKSFITDLTEAYDYDFIKCRWIAANYFIEIKEVSERRREICFLLYT